MALDETGLLVKLEANVAKWEKDFNRAITQQQRASQRMEQIARQNAKKISSAYEGIGGKIGASLGKLALPLAGGLSAAVLMRQVKNYTALADAATQMQNSLKVAGLEGGKLTDVYGKLYQSAQRNAAPISSLVDLYSKLSLTQNELGVSSDELIRFTDGIAVALRVGGTDAQAASGSLLQLSQALGGGTVRAEEFNSILEGTPTIAQAVARGLKEAGGSVAELRKLVVDGQVSSTAFFRAFEAGSAELRQQAATTQMTTGQAFTRLGNALITFVGAFDKATGASATFADGIADLANGLDNFDTEGFVAKVQKIIDVFADAEAAGTAWLNNIGNWDGWSGLSDALGGTEGGNILNPDVSAAETKIAGLEKDVTDLQAQIENNSSLGFDNTEAIARLREVRNELAALRAEAANIPRYVAGPRDPANTDTGAFYDGTGYAPPPAAPASSAPVSVKDHPAAGSGGSGGGKGGKGRKGGGGGGGASREKLDDYEREAKAIRERIALMQIEASVYSSLTGSTEDYGDAVAFAETKAKLLAAAQEAGKQVTPQLEGQINQLARSYVEAGEKADEAARKMQEADGKTEKGANALADLFSTGMEGSEAFGNALRNLAAEMLKSQVLKLLLSFGKSGAPGSGIIGAIGGALGGFASGGYTGDGGKFEPAGVVHRGEFVFSKETVQRIGADRLDAMHRAAKSGATGYATGGLVGSTAKLNRASSTPSRVSAGTTQNISLAPVINVNASGGTPEANADLAKQISHETERAMRGLIRDEMIRQGRAGGMLAR